MKRLIIAAVLALALVPTVASASPYTKALTRHLNEECLNKYKGIKHLTPSEKSALNACAVRFGKIETPKLFAKYYPRLVAQGNAIKEARQYNRNHLWTPERVPYTSHHTYEGIPHSCHGNVGYPNWLLKKAFNSYEQNSEHRYRYLQVDPLSPDMEPPIYHHRVRCLIAVQEYISYTHVWIDELKTISVRREPGTSTLIIRVSGQ